jgi:hypothetical protein
VSLLKSQRSSCRLIHTLNIQANRVAIVSSVIAKVFNVPDHEKPGPRCRLSKAHNLLGVLEIGNGEGLRKGRSVYE